jgi:hypothetical protein
VPENPADAAPSSLSSPVENDLERASVAPSQPGLQEAQLQKDSDALKSAPAAASATPPAPRQEANETSADRVERIAPAGINAKVAGAGIEIVSPDARTRWRLAGPIVERSTDGGSTWNTVFTLAGAELTAGAAPSDSACWVVGRRGVVLRSTDGRTFSLVTSPAMADLSAVTATDARSASVSTIDGSTFSTTDGGATWRRQ